MTTMYLAAGDAYLNDAIQLDESSAVWIPVQGDVKWDKAGQTVFSLYVTGATTDEAARRWARVQQMLTRAQRAANPYGQGTGVVLIEQWRGASEWTYRDVLSGTFTPVTTPTINPDAPILRGVVTLQCAPYVRTTPIVSAFGSTRTNAPQTGVLVAATPGDADGLVEVRLRDSGGGIGRVRIGQRSAVPLDAANTPSGIAVSGSLTTSASWQRLASASVPGRGLYDVLAAVQDSGAVLTSPRITTAKNTPNTGNLPPGTPFQYVVTPYDAARNYGPPSRAITLKTPSLLTGLGATAVRYLVYETFDSGDMPSLVPGPIGAGTTVTASAAYGGSGYGATVATNSRLTVSAPTWPKDTNTLSFQARVRAGDGTGLAMSAYYHYPPLNPTTTTTTDTSNNTTNDRSSTGASTDTGTSNSTNATTSQNHSQGTQSSSQKSSTASSTQNTNSTTSTSNSSSTSTNTSKSLSTSQNSNNGSNTSNTSQTSSNQNNNKDTTTITTSSGTSSNTNQTTGSTSSTNNTTNSSNSTSSSSNSSNTSGSSSNSGTSGNTNTTTGNTTSTSHTSTTTSGTNSSSSAGGTTTSSGSSTSDSTASGTNNGTSTSSGTSQSTNTSQSSSQTSSQAGSNSQSSGSSTSKNTSTGLNTSQASSQAQSTSTSTQTAAGGSIGSQTVTSNSQSNSTNTSMSTQQSTAQSSSSSSSQSNSGSQSTSNATSQGQSQSNSSSQNSNDTQSSANSTANASTSSQRQTTSTTHEKGSGTAHNTTTSTTINKNILYVKVGLSLSATNASVVLINDDGTTQQLSNAVPIASGWHLCELTAVKGAVSTSFRISVDRQTIGGWEQVNATLIDFGLAGVDCDNVTLANQYIAGGVIAGGSTDELDWLPSQNANGYLVSWAQGDLPWFSQDVGNVTQFIHTTPQPTGSVAQAPPTTAPPVDYAQLRPSIGAGSLGSRLAPQPVARTAIAGGAMELVRLGTFALPPGGRRDLVSEADVSTVAIDCKAGSTNTAPISISGLWFFPLDQQDSWQQITATATALAGQAVEWRIGTDRFGRSYARLYDSSTGAFLGFADVSGAIGCGPGDTLFTIVVERETTPGVFSPDPALTYQLATQRIPRWHYVGTPLGGI